MHPNRMRAGIEHGLGSLDAADAAADAAGKTAADVLDHSQVVAVALGRVEVDQLHSRKARKLRNPRFRAGRLDRELLALYQLDDVATLQINRGDEHQSRTGMCWASR